MCVCVCVDKKITLVGQGLKLVKVKFKGYFRMGFNISESKNCQ